MDAIRKLEDRYALEVQIGEFGQVPKQIFTSPHPQKRTKNSPTNDDVSNDGDVKKISPRSVIESKVNSVKFWNDMTKLRRVFDYRVRNFMRYTGSFFYLN